MGDPRKARPKFETPRKVWDEDRIKNDTGLAQEYGLKKTREIWTITQELKKVRRYARLQLSKGEEGKREGQKVLDKLSRLSIGKPDMELEDVLGLTVRDFLERRLQTLVLKKGLARTPKQARQLITHGFVSVNGRKVTIPSYLVTMPEEPTISYFKAIDVSPPENNGGKAGGESARRAARAAQAKEAAQGAASTASEGAEGAAGS